MLWVIICHCSSRIDAVTTLLIVIRGFLEKTALAVCVLQSFKAATTLMT